MPERCSGWEIFVLADGEKGPMMLVVQTAEDSLYMPGEEVATWTPTFTQEELELFSRPFGASDGRVDEFVAETGGIHGQARGIHADWLRPVERLIELVSAALMAEP